MSDPAPPPSAVRPVWRHRYFIAAVGVGIALAVGYLPPYPADQPALGPMAATAALMACWWVFEVVPIAVTAMLPLMLFPLLGIADLKATAGSYGKPTIYLFLGGFILALGIERSGLHRRIALRIVAAIGSRPDRLILGFMLSTALLSMWISNTASVMVMLPISMAVLSAAAKGPRPELVGRLGTALMLGVAYGADIGGMATPVGTPPNLLLIDVQQEIFPGSPAIGFGEWMTLGVPLALAFLAGGWLILTRILYKLPAEPVFGRGDAVKQQLAALGRVRRDEAITGLVFLVVALLWMTGSGVGDLQGWRQALGLEQVGDAAVAIAGAVLLFLLPSKDRPGESLMDWPTAARLPWDVLLLFGGGFALAAGFEATGLSSAIGDSMAGLRDLPVWVVVALVCTVMTFLTELTSNTATATLVLPILGKAAVAMGLHPLALMVPATLTASCAFMMPVASPTQAIVFGSGHVSIPEMARAGIWFNVYGIILVTAFFFIFGADAFSIDPSTVPAWAQP